jgi:biotin carboxyl carrier protein
VTFSVETGGTRRTIEIQRAGEGWAVTVDGQAMSAIVNPVEGHWSVLYGAGEAPASRRSYEVALEPRRKGDQLVHVDGRAIKVSFLDHPGRSRVAASPGAGSGAREVVAPMPGRIVKVLVKAGDTVAVNQGLVVVEAMKMENELRAPRAGIVESVRVSEGMAVEANAVLVVVG